MYCVGGGPAAWQTQSLSADACTVLTLRDICTPITSATAKAIKPMLVRSFLSILMPSPPIAGDENLLLVGNRQRVLRRYAGSPPGATSFWHFEPCRAKRN